jgi:predicted NUDIX family NTP pyrophosphohydrolase
MSRTSAGLLLYRRVGGILEVFLAHPGGPFWRTRDLGAWSIPKGEVGEGEALLDAAQREFREETGFDIAGPWRALTPIRQRGGKTVLVWAAEADVDPRALVSNTFTLEWPPQSGRVREYPEIDRAEWMTVESARVKILASQRPLLDELTEALALRGAPGMSS